MGRGNFTYLMSVVLWAYVVADRRPLSFTGCGGAWNCTHTPDRHLDITFTCDNNATSGDEFEVKLEGLIAEIERSGLGARTLELSDCRSIALEMHLAVPTGVKRLRVSRVGVLLLPCAATRPRYHPPDVHFQDIDLVPLLPAGTFSSPGVEDIYFENVRISHIEKGAVGSERDEISTLVWNNVSVLSMDDEAVSVNMHREGTVRIQACHLPALQARALRIKGGTLILTNTFIAALEDSAIVASESVFHFTDNHVQGKMGRLKIKSSELTLTNNQFLGGGGLPFDWGELVSSELALHMENNEYGGAAPGDAESYESGYCIIQEEVIRRDMICTVGFRTLPLVAPASAGGVSDCVMRRNLLMAAKCGSQCIEGACQSFTVRLSISRWLMVVVLAIRFA